MKTRIISLTKEEDKYKAENDQPKEENEALNVN
jgi:hypothetical protein